VDTGEYRDKRTGEKGKSVPKKPRLVSLLTNDFEMSAEEIVMVYRWRWITETLYKQLKQNFPLHFFFGESENSHQDTDMVGPDNQPALTIVHGRVKRKISFSGLATTVAHNN